MHLSCNASPCTDSCLHRLTSSAWHSHLSHLANFPRREYQFAIVAQALFKNTLVSLPTGLGKTFIAAVVMYNFFRWYPTGKIVFMAPTKPLVAQQIIACRDIVGIPSAQTAEMTGAMPPEQRKVCWRDRRVFFVTPQILANDLESRYCPREKFVCVVVDEAHRAQGKYAYCTVGTHAACKCV